MTLLVTYSTSLLAKLINSKSLPSNLWDFEHEFINSNRLIAPVTLRNQIYLYLHFFYVTAGAKHSYEREDIQKHYKYFIIQARNINFASKTINGYRLTVNKICYNIQTQLRFATTPGQTWNGPGTYMIITLQNGLT